MEGEEKKEKTEKITDEEAEQAFLEGTGETSAEKKEAPAKEKETPAEKKEMPAEEKETPGEKKETPPEKKDSPSYEALEKALNDTKTWAHGLATRLSKLEKGETKPTETPGEKKETQAKDKETPAEEAIPDDIKEFLDDYPEAKPAIQHFAKQLLKQELATLGLSELPADLASVKETIAQSNFQMQVIAGIPGDDGKWIAGHPDAIQVMATSEFKAFWEAETKVNPAIPGYGAKEAIEFLSRFKREKARWAAGKHDNRRQDQTVELEEMAGVAPESGTSERGGKRKKDEDKSPEELFEQGAK